MEHKALESTRDYKGVTDQFAWYELSRMRDYAEGMVTRLKTLEDALKEQSEATQNYFSHLTRTIEKLEAANAQLQEAKK